jgi:hypothetical protein
MTKQCCSCKDHLLTSEFNKKTSSKDGLQNVCRGCNRLRSKRYYEENRDEHLEVILARNKENRSANQKFIQTSKEGKSCLICGESEPCCLDYHHVEADSKKFIISAGITYSRAALEAEMAKCVLVCSNCHRKIHWGIIAPVTQLVSVTAF